MNDNVLTFDVTALAQSLAEPLNKRSFLGRCRVADVADLRSLAHLLRLRSTHRCQKAHAKRNNDIATCVHTPTLGRYPIMHAYVN